METEGVEIDAEVEMEAQGRGSRGGLYFLAWQPASNLCQLRDRLTFIGGEYFRWL